MSDDIYKHSGSRDRFAASVMYDIRKNMTAKIALLRAEQDKLNEQLKAGFDVDTYRQLSIINHHIEVATVRRKGDWLYGNFPQFKEISKSNR